MTNKVLHKDSIFIGSGFLLCILYYSFDLANFYFANVAACIAILLFGLPHGSYDLFLLKHNSTLLSFTAKSLLYILAALSFVVIWWVNPTVFIVLFFVISAIHFGDSDWPQETHFFRIVWGLSIISLPFLFDTESAANYVGYLLGSEYAASLANILHYTSLVILPICTVLSFKRSNALASLITISMVFAMTTPIVGFGFYFCIFHSLRHLSFWKKRVSFPSANMIVNLTSIAVVIFFVAYAFYAFKEIRLDHEWIRATFLMLAALTLPHIITVHQKKRFFNQSDV